MRIKALKAKIPVNDPNCGRFLGIDLFEWKEMEVNPNGFHDLTV
jgi:hypothetical protein